MRKIEPLLVMSLVAGLGIIYLNSEFDFLESKLSFKMPFHKTKLSLSEQAPYLSLIHI